MAAAALLAVFKIPFRPSVELSPPPPPFLVRVSPLFLESVSPLCCRLRVPPSTAPFCRLSVSPFLLRVPPPSPFLKVSPLARCILLVLEGSSMLVPAASKPAGLVGSHSHSIRARRLTHYVEAGLGRGCKCVSRHSLSLTQASKHTLAQLEEVTLNHSKPAVLVRGHSAAGTTLRPCQREAGSHPHRHVFTRLGGDSEATAGPPSHSASEEESPMEASQPRQTPRTPTKRIPPPCSTPCQHPIVHPP